MTSTLKGLIRGGVAAALLVSATVTMPAQASSKLDIVDTAMATGQFKTLVTAVKEAGLVSVLKGAGPLTVFAPTDEAFAKLPAGTLDKLLKDKKALKNVLLHHTIAANVASSDMATMKSLSMLFGNPLPIWKAGGKLHLGSAALVKPDIATRNGTIHVIDKVLVP